ncbi:MAG: signal peptidase II [Vulcanimicrobiota bacterium]
MRVRLMVLALVVFLVDQLSKLAALHWLRPLGSIEMPGGWALTYSENTGGAFSFMTGHNHLFIIFGIVITIGLLYAIRSTEDLTLPHAYAFGLILGGAAGNLLDRIRHSFVVDFLDFKIWPVFNLADSGITVGIVILVILMVFEGRNEPAQSQA